MEKRISQPEEAESLATYRQLFNQHGLSYKSLNWGSSQSQQLRFKVLSEIGALEGKCILDVGCGLGDFAGWLNRHHINVAYTGLDLTKDFIQQARISYPSCEFVHGSINDDTLFKDCTFDFVFASGIFYTYPLGRADWMRKAIMRMWSLCKEGISFNSLSAWADSHDSGEFYADPVETISICKELTRSIVFRHDYHLRDFTVYLYNRPELS